MSDEQVRLDEMAQADTGELGARERCSSFPGLVRFAPNPKQSPQHRERPITS
jgi:hypothetical protein